MKYINQYTGGSLVGLFLLMSGVLNAQETQPADDGSANQTQVQSQAQIRSKTGTGEQAQTQAQSQARNQTSTGEQVQTKAKTHTRVKTANGKLTRNQQPAQPGANAQREQNTGQARQPEGLTKGGGRSQKGKKRGNQRK